MTDQISYFNLAAFLADIEPDYERYLDPIEKKQRLVLAVWERWFQSLQPQTWPRLRSGLFFPAATRAIIIGSWQTTAMLTKLPR